MMDDRSEVLLATDDPAVENAIAAVISAEERFVSGETFRNLTALANRLEANNAPIALVDVDPEPMKALDDLGAIIGRFPQTRFALLCTEMSNEIVLKAMRIGVRHVEVKSSIGSELGAALHHIAPEDAGAEDRRGKVLTVLSAGGGCGATTLVVNLANEIGLRGSSQVLAIDLDSHYGAVATYLGLEGRFGIADVTAHTGRIDPQLIASTALHFSDQFHVLLSPSSVDFFEPKPLKEERLDIVLAACRRVYDYTVIDAPRLSMSTAAKLVRISDQTLLAFQLTVKDIRTVNSMLAALNREAISLDRVKLVVNRYRKRRPMIGLREAQKALDGRPLKCLSNDYDSALQSLNYGNPLAQSAPRSTLRKDISRLAAELCESHPIQNGTKVA